MTGVYLRFGGMYSVVVSGVSFKDIVDQFRDDIDGCFTGMKGAMMFLW